MQHHYEDTCATSPCTKDKVRRKTGVGVYVVAQLMIMMTTFAALYAGFTVEHPSMFIPGTVAALSLRQFIKMAPWNLRKAKHESCLCKACENFSCYEKGLATTIDVLTEAFKLDAGVLT